MCPCLCSMLPAMRLRRGQLLTVTIGLGVAVLAACSSSGGGATDTPTLPPPTSAPTSSAPTTPSPTPSQTGPLTTGPNVRPGEKPPIYKAIAKQHNNLGAMAFAQYYIQVIDWSIATTDTYLLRQISAPTCKACKRWINDLDQLAAEHGYVKGGRLTIGEVRRVDAIKTGVKSDYIVDVKYVQAPDVIIYPHAAPSTDNSKPVNTGSYVFVSWRDGAWSVIEEEDDS